MTASSANDRTEAVIAALDEATAVKGECEKKRKINDDYEGGINDGMMMVLSSLYSTRRCEI
jgi:hypothetical protein